MNLSKKTKIVCTIGPATESVEKLTALVNAGMNIMRLNFSHGDFAEHQVRIENLKEVVKKTGKTVGVFQDLSGPKIRTGEFDTPTVDLKVGSTFTFTTEKIVGNEKKVHINYPLLPKEVKVGGYILVDDGKKKFQITDIKGNEVITKVIAGGVTKPRRGVNLPGAYLSISSITEKDRKDLEFGVKNKVDFVALSFVRRPADVAELRDLLKEEKSNAGIISKIETPEAIENIDEIINLSDAIMVARGDLAVEIPAEEVPLVQKMIIQKCNALGKPVITATQMLESMIKTPVPTRAEVSDVANAIIDGTDAIMLSEETTLGEFPVQAVEMMTRIALRVEEDVYTTDTIAEYDESHGTTDVVSKAAVIVAHEVEAKFIIAVTESGRTARMIARYRPAERILAITSSPITSRKLMLSFGCYSFATDRLKSLDEVMTAVRKIALKEKYAGKGDKVVIVGGVPLGKIKETNMIVVETI